VLEVGTGSGYQAAVLLELGAKVFTIERQHELYLKSRTLLTRLGYKPYFFFGDGYEGVPRYALYDKIIVTAGAPEVPQKLIEQLKVGGRMVIPFGGSSGQTMLLIEKLSTTEIRQTEHGSFAFVPMLKGKNK
jgi:protein-L-isoaspartate(D-aspartate) O-methyltransferase